VGAERVDVAAVVHDAAAAQRLLGAGVPEGAEDLAGGRQAVVAGHLGEPEVGHPELPPRVEEQVPRLDVAVDDAGLVGVLQGDRGLPAEPGDPVEVPPPGGRPLGGEPCDGGGGRRRGPRRLGLSRVQGLGDGQAEVGDQGGEALPVDELHGVVVDAALAPDGVDRDDVLVPEVGGGRGLVLEPLELPGVDGRDERQDLQGHPPPQADLLGLVHHPHAAAAHLADEPEVAEPTQRGFEIEDWRLQIVGRGQGFQSRIGNGQSAIPQRGRPAARPRRGWRRTRPGRRGGRGGRRGGRRGSGSRPVSRAST